MALTPKQAAQVAKAPPERKKALREAFMAQNARRPAPPAPAPTPAPSRARRRQNKSAIPPTMPKKTSCQNFLDPMCPTPVPAVLSDGKALPHTGLVSKDFVVGTVNTKLLLVTNPGDSGTVGLIVELNPSYQYVSADIFTIPTLDASDIGGGASALRAMKLSVSVVNCSNALKRGGRVTYINSSQRLPSQVDQAGLDYSAVVAGVKNSPYRRRITGDNLAHPSHLIGFPVDSIEYATFMPNRGAIAGSAFLQHVLQAGPHIPVVSHRPMSVIAYVFDPVAADQQDYSVTIRASYYTRWPLTSVPGQSMKDIPTAHAGIVNSVRDHVENTANDLKPLAEGGVVALAAPKIASAARSAGGSLFSRVGNMLSRGATAVAETAEGMAVDALGAEGAALAEMALPLL